MLRNDEFNVKYKDIKFLAKAQSFLAKAQSFLVNNLLFHYREPIFFPTVNAIADTNDMPGVKCF